MAARQFAVLKMFCSLASQIVEITTIGSGAALAAAMAWSPASITAAVPCLAVLHRSALREAIQRTRAYDPRTGLWAEAAWRSQGQQMLDDSGYGYVALVIIDPSEPGCEAAIVANLGCGVRQRRGPKSGDPRTRDLVGRYGTRQVAVLLEVGPASAGRLFMSRIQVGLASAGVPATLGVAVTAGGDMDELVMDSVSDLMRRRDQAGVEHRW